jgi:formylglycine-generating enzyme required for sulfatase activity
MIKKRLLLTFLPSALSLLLAYCGGDTGKQSGGEVKQSANELLPESITDSIGIEFRLIKPGTFWMGSNAVPGNYNPAHKITITHPFYISVREITQAQYEMIMEENPSEIEGSDRPVTNITWHDAVEFCEQLTRRENVRYRLPTEAEWEYAYRAGTTTKYYWGGAFDVRALRRPNPWGLLDMAGGVREWCLDWFAPYGVADLVDPFNDTRIERLKIVRGGYSGVETNPLIFTHYFRDSTNPDTSLDANIGFRVVRVVE